MSDTPETDYETNYRSFGFYTMGGLPADVIGVEFARNLERERNRYYNELLIKKGLCKIQEQVIDNWKEVVGKNFYEHEEECRQLRASFSNVIADLQDTIFDLRKDRDKLQYKLELWMDEVEKWREIANDNRN